jgi:hypothetical protein
VATKLKQTERRAIVLSLVIAVVLLTVSFVVRQLAGGGDGSRVWPWVESLLLNLGSAVALVAPIEWMSSRLRVRVEEVDARQSVAISDVRDEAGRRVDTLSSQIAEIDTRVTSLAELAAAVDADRDTRSAKDEELFSSLGTEGVARDVLLRAVDRAVDQGLITMGGVRVSVGRYANSRVRFGLNAREGLRVSLEDVRGDELAELQWGRTEDAVSFLSRVGDAVFAQGETLDTVWLFERLSRTLLIALRYPSVRPLIEHFPSQWVLMEDALVAPEHDYRITHDRLDRSKMDVHVRQKQWLDHGSYDEAFAVAALMFPMPTTR